jgi:phage tail P2-like protein
MAEFDSILPSNASPAMRAVEQVSGERWDIDVDVIRRFKDPWQCPAHLLNFLAYERSVDIWNENWPEWKKRSVIASSPHDHRIKGTLAGIERYIEIADGRLAQSLTPPQDFYLASDLTKEQWDEWIAQMPRVRITLAHTEGEWLPPAGIFLDESAFDADHFVLNDGPYLHGRRALLRAHAGAEDVPLEIASVETTATRKAATDYERVVVPGEDSGGLILDEGALGVSYLDGQASQPRIYTYALDRTYDHIESLLALTMLDVGLEPQSVRYKRESDIGDAEGRLFLDDGVFDVDVSGRNDGGELLADVLYLLDPAVAAPLVDAISFMDVSRMGMPAYHAELMIEAPKELEFGFVLDQSVMDVDLMVDDDLGHIEFIMDAVVSAQALRDKILVTFETTKPLTLGDAPRLDGGLSLGDRVPAYL